MTHKQRDIAVSTASVLYGVVAILTVLLPLTAEDLTISGVIWGGAGVGIAAQMTYYFKEVVHREADADETLGFSEHFKELARALPVLIFPAAAMTIGAVGLAAGVPADPLIDGLFYFGLAIVCAAAFLSSYLVHQNLPGALSRALVWAAICVILLVMKKLA